MSFGPLYAYVCPLDLEWWCWQLAKAQALETGLTTDGEVVDLMADQVKAIEDVFPDLSVAPGQMRLRQTPLSAV